ncbi:MAG TPA: LexA family transcriptional regulator [Hanamia sp.]|nr:LexA family transcriptional regulator [Hanamia sp.]
MFHEGEILQAYIELNKLSKTNVAEALGVSRQQLYQSFNSKEFESNTIKKIEKSLGKSFKELKNFYNVNIDNWQKLKERKKKDLKQESYIEKRRNLKNNKLNTLTYYDIGAHAGPVGDIIPVAKNEGVLHISDLFRGSQFAIRISGNSMMPNYPPGSIIGIREVEDKQISPGSVYVVEKGSDLWIKRLFYKDDNQDTGIFELVSDNRMKFENGPREGKMFYPPFYLEIDKIKRLFKVTGIYKANELSVISKK